MTHAIRIILATLVASLLLAPTVASRTDTKNYFVGNGQIIIYASNYYLPNFDFGGNRFHVYPGETTVTMTISGGPATGLLDFQARGGVVLATYVFCGNEITAPIPEGAFLTRVFVGADASFPTPLYPGAPTCGVIVPPPAGTITAHFA